MVPKHFVTDPIPLMYFPIFHPSGMLLEEIFDFAENYL